MLLVCQRGVVSLNAEIFLMGNPNPDMSGLKPFEKGCSGNPAGKTSAHRKAEIAAAEKAALVSEILVTAVYDAVKDADTDTAREQIKGDVLTLLRNVQDRAHGTPKQTVEADVTKRKVPKSLDAFYGTQVEGADVQVDDDPSDPT
jgi:hypothetical protein